MEPFQGTSFAITAIIAITRRASVFLRPTGILRPGVPAFQAGGSLNQ